MPETYSTKPPPPSRTSKTKNHTSKSAAENTINKKETDKGN